MWGLDSNGIPLVKLSWSHFPTCHQNNHFLPGLQHLCKSTRKYTDFYTRLSPLLGFTGAHKASFVLCTLRLWKKYFLDLWAESKRENKLKLSCALGLLWFVGSYWIWRHGKASVKICGERIGGVRGCIPAAGRRPEGWEEPFQRRQGRVGRFLCQTVRLTH